MNLKEDDLKCIEKNELIKAYKQVEGSRDRVFSVVSHDLRSPFSGLLGLSEMLATDAKSLSPEQLQEYLVTMRDSLRNTYMLLENLFEWGQIERDRYEKTVESIPLKILFDEILEDLSEKIDVKEIKFSHLYHPEQLIVANSKMAEFILKNIISNAVKFSYRGGIVELGCINSEGVEGETAVFVRDFGAGIAEENLSKLFSMDTSWKMHGTLGESGTGLGLLTSARFAAAFGARMEVKSAPLQGSTFSLILTEPPRLREILPVLIDSIIL